jgi:hypothetical protein
VILIAPKKHPLAGKFKTGEHKYRYRYQQVVDESRFGDLTSDSQTKLLGTEVNFQGSEIALNQLTSADSPITDILTLAHLTEENPLDIGNPLPVSKGYDEGYYMGRTFNQHIQIKRDIFNDKKVGKISDLLAKTEEEFTQLCTKNPTKLFTGY